MQTKETYPAEVAKLEKIIERFSDKEIKVCIRGSDFHACLAENPTLWGCGRTMLEAIGDLVFSHPQAFNIKIVTK